MAEPSTAIAEAIPALMQAGPLLRTPDGNSTHVALFVHWSGAGGTTMWSALRKAARAYKNVRVAPVADGLSNGNVGPLARNSRWSESIRPGGQRMTCRDALQTSYQLFAIENPVAIPWTCAGVAYWTVLRDPVSRFMSRMFRNTREGVMGLDGIPTVLQALNHTVLLHTSLDTPGMPEFSGTPTVDNWYVRSLNGPSVYRLGLGQITTDHLEIAIKRLSKMNVVPIEQLSSPHFASLLGLPAVETRGRSSSFRTTRFSTQESAQLEYVMARLRHQNHLDLLLYNHSTQLFRERTVGLRESSSPPPGPSLPPPSPLPVPRLVWFLHLHKAGGTSFTDLATLNHETKRLSSNVPGATKDLHSHIELNWNGAQKQLRWPLIRSQTPLTGAAFAPRCISGSEQGGSLAANKVPSQSIDAEINRLIAANVTFVSSEHWFPDLSVYTMPPAVVLAVLIREPMQRLLSSYQFHNCGHGRCNTSEAAQCRFSEWSRAESNLYVRMLNGQPFGPSARVLGWSHDCTMEYSAHAVGDTELSVAKRALLSFQLVLTFDTLLARPQEISCAISRVLGWSHTVLPHSNSNRAPKQCPGGLTVEDWEVGAARDANRLDTDLYAHAMAVEYSILGRHRCHSQSSPGSETPREGGRGRASSVPYEALAADAEIANRSVIYRPGQTIPHVLHYTWPNKNFSFGEGEDPDGKEQRKILKAVETIRGSNAGWEVKVWTDEECFALMDAYFPEFMKEYKKLLDPRKLWDIARIVILYVHGGIYLDHDIECQPGVSFSAPGWADNATELLLPSETELDSKRQQLTAPRSQNPNVRSLNSTHSRGNYFMGSVPGHPFWRVYWRNVMDLLPKHKEVWVLDLTGPRQLSHSFQEYSRSGLPASVRVLLPHQMALPSQRGQWQCMHTRSISPAELQVDKLEYVSQQVKNYMNRIYKAEAAKSTKINGMQRSENGEAPWSVSDCNPCSRPITVHGGPAGATASRQRIVAVHVPKTGGTFVEKKLGLTRPCHATAVAIEACDPVSYAKAVSFGNLRNPVQRALSMYHYARQGGNGYQRDAWAKRLPFSKFVDGIRRRNDLVYAPQSYFLTGEPAADAAGGSAPPSLRVKRLLCLESIDKDWRDLVEAFGLEGWEVESTGKVIDRNFDVVKRKGKDQNESTTAIDNATMAQLHRLYKTDFILWHKHCNVDKAASQRAASVGTWVPRVPQTIVY